MLDIAKTLFPDHFELINGLIQMGYYSGTGLGSFIGIALYEGCGYKAVYLYCTCVMVVVMLIFSVNIPACPSITLIESKDDEVTQGVTRYVFLPAAACTLINCVYAFLNISTTPYLYHTFNVPLQLGGFVLIILSGGFALGSSLSGAIANTRVVNTYTQMACGSGMVGLGLLLLFPSPSVTLLYNVTPYMAYPAALIAGIGDPMITIPTLLAMTTLQVQRTGTKSVFFSKLFLSFSKSLNLIFPR